MEEEVINEHYSLLVVCTSQLPRVKSCMCGSAHSCRNGCCDQYIFAVLSYQLHSASTGSHASVPNPLRVVRCRISEPARAVLPSARSIRIAADAMAWGAELWGNSAAQCLPLPACTHNRASKPRAVAQRCTARAARLCVTLYSVAFALQPRRARPRSSRYSS